MSDCIITVESSSIIVASQEDCEVTIIPSETAVTVIPGRTNETTISLTTPEVVITPTIFDPYIDQSYGVQDLYIFVIDIEQLEIWQHNLNTVSDLVDALIIKCQTIEDNIDNIEINIDSIEDDIRVLQEDAITLSNRIDILNLNYGTLSALVDQHSILIANLGGDIDDLNQLFINLNTSLESLDGRISANASLINLQEVSITQNTDGLEILAISMTALGVSISDLEAGYTANSNAIQSLQADIVTIHGEVVATASSITVLDSTISGLDGRIDVNATAVDSMYTEVNDLSDEFSALSAHTIELIAEVPSTFNPALAWEFIADLEGWVSGGSATLIFDVDSAKITGDGHAEVTFDEPVAGLQNSVVTLRWKCTLDINPFVGEIYYRYTGDAGSFVLGGSFSHIYGYSEYRQSTIDCDWGDKAITAIAVKFSTGGTFLIDSIGIGYKTGFGAMAYIRKQSIAWVTESTAYADDQTALNARIDTNEANLLVEGEVQALINGSTATWKVEASTVPGVVTGIYLTSSSTGGVIDTSEFKVQANHFIVVGTDPTLQKAVFEVATRAGNEYIRLAGDVLIEQDIQSDNYDASTHAGWKIDYATDTASFNGISIYNTAGNLILSSGAGIESSGLVATIEDDMATALLGSSTTANQFNADYYASILTAIETDSASYIETLMVNNLFTSTAYIQHAHILDLTVGSNNIQYNGVSSFTFLETTSHTISGDVTVITTTINVPAVLDAGGSSIPPYIKLSVRIHYMLDAYNSGIRIERDGNIIYTQYLPAYPGITSHGYATCIDHADHTSVGLTTGSHTYNIILYGPSGNFSIIDADLSIQIMKR